MFPFFQIGQWISDSPGGSVLPAESEPAKLSYRPPTSLSMDFHHFPTTGGFVVLEGIDLGLCAHVVVDGVVYGSYGSNDA